MSHGGHRDQDGPYEGDHPSWDDPTPGFGQSPGHGPGYGPNPGHGSGPSYGTSPGYGHGPGPGYGQGPTTPGYGPGAGRPGQVPVRPGQGPARPVRPGEYGRGPGRPGAPGIYGGAGGAGRHDGGLGLDGEPKSWAARNRSIVAVAAAFATVVVLATGGWLLLKPSGNGEAVAGGVVDSTRASVDPTPSPTPTVDPTTPTAPKTTATRKVIPKPTVTVKPPAKEIPPAPPPPPPPPPGCPTKGTDASHSEVKLALVAAGHREYWRNVQLPTDLTVPLPTITVPDNLMKAFAYQESGWQSSIIACDGGIGTMQLMSYTVDTVNNRFGTDFDVNTLAGNTQLGAQYIEWLIMYFGIYHFSQNFDLNEVAAVGPGGSQVSLLQAVTAAYNVGPAALEQADGTLKFGPVATQYSNNVIALMTTCECLAW